MIKKKITNKTLVRYYQLFWQLTMIHKDLGGNTPRTSERFSESLCSEIFELKKSDHPDYDLQTKENNFKKIEIKGTTSEQGKTTINRRLPLLGLHD